MNVPVSKAVPDVADSPPAPRRFRLRPDLRIEPQLYAGEPCYIVKDPVSLAYFRFTPVQREMLALIDDRTIAEICDAAGRRLRRPPPTEAEVEGLLRLLAASGLVTHDGAGQGAALHEQADRLRQARRGAWLRNLLYIKLPGIDPEPLLTRLHPWFRWVYSPLGVAAAVCLMLFAAGYTLVHLDEFLVRLRRESLEQFLTVRTIFWLWIALGVSKVVHEFGHGLTCKHFGGECHDMGMLFLVFSPSLYCDATDAWTMPNKWHRIAVSFGGIYVELVIASASSLLWWHTSPGILHDVALALMALCSINTCLLNANPLMRFDGYYILSDLIEIPNLRVRAQQALRGLVERRLLGVQGTTVAYGGARTGALLTYAVAAWFYKWFLCALILWFFYTVLEPYRLSSLSLLLAVVVAVQLLIFPLWRSLMRIWSLRIGPQRFHWGRLLASACGLAGLAAAAVWAPIPNRVRAPLVIQGRDSREVHVSVPGRVDEVLVRDNQVVRSGDVIARMLNPDLEAEVVRLESEIRRLGVAAERFAALKLPGEQAAALALIERTREELAARRLQQEQLVIQATCDGRVVMAPRSVDDGDDRRDYQPLTNWVETPLDPHNVGARWELGTVLCELQPTDEVEAIAYVEQSDLEFVSRGQSVWIKLDAFPGRTFAGAVTDIARLEASGIPSQLFAAHGGELAGINGERGQLSPAVTCYEVRVAIDPAEEGTAAPNSVVLRTGLRGRARIECGRWTCFAWLSRDLHELLAR